MTVDFSEYLEALGKNDHEHLQVLESSYQEATRILSPRGLSHYLEGMRAISALNRGQDLVLTYLQEIPGVAREVGEDIIPDIVEAMMKLASHTSGSMITLILSNLPMAASRLGDIEVLRGFLTLLHHMSARAPRGLRPMIESLDELLSLLTLGGLRRWIAWGVQAHPRDFNAQVAYFGLNTASSKAVLQGERRGTLFVDNQRKLNFYLRALWGRAFFMRPTAGDFESRQGIKPFIEDFQIYLPDAFDRFHGIAGLEIYRAAAAHAAAHLVYTRDPMSAETLSQAQMYCVELFEDARIEYLAYQAFPGLRHLWLSMLKATIEKKEAGTQLHESMRLMLCTTRAIMDPDYEDNEPLVHQIAAAFVAALKSNPDEAGLARRFGIDIHQQITRLSTLPSARILSDWPLPYRDDNRFIWAFSENEFIRDGFNHRQNLDKTLRRNVSVMEMVNEVDSELTHDNPQQVWVLNSELFPYEDLGVSYNEMEGREPVSEPRHYSEWDYQVQLARPDWATVIERRQGRGDPAIMEGILNQHKPVAARIRHLIDAMQPQGVVRKRGYEEGDALDLNAAISAMIDLRRGVMPDPRFNIRITRKTRDLSVLVLMDLSESTNQRPGPLAQGQDGYEKQPSILDLTRASTGLLAWAIDSIGDNFAIHGFASDGRHDVQYYPFKHFDQHYDDEAKSRMAGMQAGLSTRMGTALRHAGWHLAQQPTQKRLVLLITDGEPADIDERDPQYLRLDAKKAVEDLAMSGIHSFCLTLDPDADRYVSRIFGENNYSIVDHVERLPERLPAIFSALTR